MASDASEEGPTTVRLPGELGEWVAEKAAALGVDEETVVLQLLAACRATSANEAIDPADLFDGLDADDAAALRAGIAEQFPVIAAAVDGTLPAGTTTDRAVEERLGTEIDRIESEFAEKLTDVRERVVQVKRETDAKADADRTDQRLSDLSAAIEGLESELDDLRSTSAESGAPDADRAPDAERLAELESRIEALESLDERIGDLEERLRTVAWAVSDLRDEQAAADEGARAIDRLKRSAAEADVDRAVCEHCGEGVRIALLSETSCPHCDAAVTDVRPAGGFFGKAKLTGPEQLESGERPDGPTGGDRA